MAKIPVSKYPNQAGYLQFDTVTNEVEVFSDGKFKSVTENSEYFNIYKNSKLLFESTTDYYGLPHYLVTDPATMKQYIVARKSSIHGLAQADIVKIDLASKEETILLDGADFDPTNADFRDGILFYNNNTPFIMLVCRKLDVDRTPLGMLVVNALTGDVIKYETSLKLQHTSYIKINDDIYFTAPEIESNGLTHFIVKYSIPLNTFTVLNSFTTEVYEAEQTMAKINGHFILISRTHSSPEIFTIYKLNDDWSVKSKELINIPFATHLTPPYLFRKGNKILFTFLSRDYNTPGYLATPGLLFTYEIIEENETFHFNLKSIFQPLLPEDVYHLNETEYIYPTGYQLPVMLPFSKTGLILVEDTRTTPSYRTRLYQLDYDNDISVDYSNF